MSNFVGRMANLGLAIEATRGTGLTPTFWLPYRSVTVDDKAVAVVQDTGFGNIADSDETYLTKKFSEGEIAFDLEDLALGTILSGLLGESPTTAGAPTYTHTYVLDDDSNQHQSLSILVKDPNGQTMFPLSMVDTFEINVLPKRARFSKWFRVDMQKRSIELS